MRCLVVDDEPLAHRIIKNYCDNLSFLTIAKECYSAFEAINYLNENEVDLIFLDINMPTLKGLDFLRTLSNPPLIIITSAYQEYAIDGYELNILDYLLKPFSFERFLKAVTRALDQNKLLKAAVKPVKQIEEKTAFLTDNIAHDSIFIKGDKKTHQVQLQNILYLESIGSYVKIHLLNNKETIITLDRLTNFEDKLPKHHFLRIHRSYIVAIKKVSTIEGNRVKILNKAIPIGSVYKHNLIRFIK